MYSIKPGRGPSAMGAIGGVAAAIFGVCWTIGAASMGAPWFFVLWGVVFVGLAVVGIAYNFHNAMQRDRMSSFDITTGQEEGDPVARALGYDPRADDERPGRRDKEERRRFDGDFCPFCGAEASRDFDYCPKCGKDI